MKITILQLNPLVGDVDGNMQRLVKFWEDAYQQGYDLVVTPELYLTGYPPRDLLGYSWFIEKCHRALDELAEISKRYPDTGLITGAPIAEEHKGRQVLYNAAILIYRGEIIFRQFKSLLPMYDVFDETRYFEPAPAIKTVPFKGESLGISICEDVWNNSELWPQSRLYDTDPIDTLAEQGATLMINISASPFRVGKEKARLQIIRKHACKHRVPFIYVNQVGGNDELVFDGCSLFVDSKGNPVKVLPAFSECQEVIDTEAVGDLSQYTPQEDVAMTYSALVTGIRDYIHKCGFRKTVVGLSGGIDSAVTCCLACEALGNANVQTIAMPSPYTSSRSVEDAKKLADNLGVDFKVIPIENIYQSYENSVKQYLPVSSNAPEITLENVQARIRGNILMAFSNQQGSMVLSTGNKSEMAVGYCTLYGDMSGGLSVLADVPKTMVYEIANYINREQEILPRAIIERAPSAELKPNQTDQDTLPPYPVLDEILNLYIEKFYSREQIVAAGFDPQTVLWVLRAVEKNEYKRRQAAPGLRISTKAFGSGRRMPVAAYQDYTR